MTISIILTVLAAYLIGAIPFGLIISKYFKGIDVRKHGSGNIGFANVLRIAGYKAGAATLLGDISKGIIAVVLAGVIVGEQQTLAGSLTIDRTIMQVVAATLAIIGHNWSIYLKFHGGRGVDTALGGLIAMSPWVGLACLAIGVLVMAIIKYVSVGSMIGTASSIIILTPLVIWEYEPFEYLIYGSISTAIIVFRHRENIVRLRNGTESKLGRTRSQPI